MGSVSTSRKLPRHAFCVVLSESQMARVDVFKIIHAFHSVGLGFGAGEGREEGGGGQGEADNDGGQFDGREGAGESGAAGEFHATVYSSR